MTQSGLACVTAGLLTPKASSCCRFESRNELVENAGVEPVCFLPNTALLSPRHVVAGRQPAKWLGPDHRSHFRRARLGLRAISRSGRWSGHNANRNGRHRQQAGGRAGAGKTGVNRKEAHQGTQTGSSDAEQVRPYAIRQAMGAARCAPRVLLRPLRQSRVNNPIDRGQLPAEKLSKGEGLSLGFSVPPLDGERLSDIGL
jgi:hypothetical protein